jgi:hypothetical protein
LVTFLIWVNGALYQDTMEARIIHNLRTARSLWLNYDCPRPLDTAEYLGTSSFSTDYVYTADLVLKDTRLESGSRELRGLFATKNNLLPGTYVIATTGEIVIVDQSGTVRLLRRD